MEIALTIIIGVLFTLIGLVCVVAVAIGLPGAWIMIAMAVGIELVDDLYRADDGGSTFGWWLIGGCVVLGGIGELLEFVAGALGAGRAGSSRRGMVGALIGGIVGAFLGIGLPVPIVGSLIGAVVGTFVGAIVGEVSGEDTTVRDSLRPATGATIGRVLGTLSKIPIAVAIWAVLSIAAFWP